MRLVRDDLVGVVVGTTALCLTSVAIAPIAGPDDVGAVAATMLLLVVLVAARWGYVAGLTSAFSADILLNFFFVPPLYTLTVREPRDGVVLFAFLGSALVAATLLARFKAQVGRVQQQEAELRALLALSQAVAHASSPVAAVDALADVLRRAVGARSCSVLAHRHGRWETVAPRPIPASLTRDQVAAADHARASGEVVSLMALPNSRKASFRHGDSTAVETFVAFSMPSAEAGVIHLRGQLTRPESGDLVPVLRAFANEASAALQRVRLANEARRADVYQRADEMKSVLLSTVSHDLRSPLTAIKAAVGSLRQPGIAWPEEDREAFLETIEAETDRLTSTVAGLLSLSRIEGGAVRPQFEPVEVQHFLEDIVSSSRTVTAGRDVRVVAPPDVTVNTDAGLLSQALINLVENAAKYSRPAGALTLRADVDGDQLVLSVADEGPAIAAGDLPHIFDKFYRGHHTAGPGTGLGLAIVRAVAELCGGEVGVEATTDGNVFRVRLLRAPGAA
ncbi:MAG: ATP-binding protein [Dehalococcoidia bacterium]